MERNFTDENFERFLRHNADGLRMRPSDKVWDRISNRMDRRRRRLGFLLAGVLALSGGLGYYLIDQTRAPQKAAQESQAPASRHASAPQNATGSEAPLLSQAAPSLLTLTNGVTQRRTGSRISTATIPALTGSGLSGGDRSLETQAYVSQPVDEDFTRAPHTNSDALASTEAVPLNPQTIESVVNLYTPRHRNGKFGMQVYFTPTVSYRSLSDNNIDNVVVHKPDFGFELGLAAKYRIGRNLKLRGGLQFNVNRYDIKTNESYTELATIRLNSRFGADSLNAATNYNNVSGKPNWLQNFYFQVSAPVGVELRLKGDEHMQFGIASTIQPTYVLGDRAYLISSDYKNYAEVPRLIRRWNVNTSFETFVAYSTGHLKWQVGPQVRYQLLSSYVKKYPVRENLFDFGLKVGMSLNK